MQDINIGINEKKREKYHVSLIEDIKAEKGSYPGHEFDYSAFLISSAILNTHAHLFHHPGLIACGN